MRVLLDECLPRQLSSHLVGHSVRTVTQEGWSGIENGELLRLAATGFDVFVTIDRKLEWQEDLPPGLALVTLKAHSNRLASLVPLIPQVLDALSSIQPGDCVRLGIVDP